ncbi:hypothetical protein LSUE1_G001842 [Lachnellula suecica]|uniref:Uncharacterized protein n=1 Tax=Lachnellula suecica TaxID=602035 RepID=A0A8T9CEY8_9HELO|nr:hypothetical protein LSUE1_G001842 [Lachnellula suecica]
MEGNMKSENGFLPLVVPSLVSPYVVVLLAGVGLIFFTRIVSGYCNLRLENESQHSESVVVLPYWIPYIGHTANLAISKEALYAWGQKSTKNGIYGLQTLGAQYYVVLMPSLVQQYFAQRPSILSGDDLLHLVFDKSFGDGGAAKRLLPEEFHTTQPAHGANDEGAISVRCYQQNHSVCGGIYAEDRILLFRSRQPDGVGETHQSYIRREFSLSGPLLADNQFRGAFFDNNPGSLQDLWLFDGSFSDLLYGLPSFTSKGRAALAARTGLSTAMNEWRSAFINMLKGQDNEYKWADLSDIPEFLRSRYKVQQDLKVDDRYAVAFDLSLYWGLMANANKIIFWMLACHCFTYTPRRNP